MKYTLIFVIFYSIFVSILCFALINNAVSLDQKIWIPLWGSIFTASATVFVALGAQMIASNQRDWNIKNSINQTLPVCANNINENYHEMIVAKNSHKKGMEFPSEYIEYIYQNIGNFKNMFGEDYKNYYLSLLNTQIKPMPWSEISSGSMLLYFINQETKVEKISEMEENRREIFEIVFNQYKYCQLHLNCKKDKNWKKIEEKFR